MPGIALAVLLTALAAYLLVGLYVSGLITYALWQGAKEGLLPVGESMTRGDVVGMTGIGMVVWPMLVYQLWLDVFYDKG